MCQSLMSWLSFNSNSNSHNNANSNSTLSTAMLPASASLSLVTAAGVGISVTLGAAVYWWATSSDVPLSMRLTIGLLRGLGAALNRMFVRWPSSKDVSISYWDAVLDESDDDAAGQEDSDQSKRSQRVIVIRPNVSASSPTDYSRIYINWHGGGFCGGYADEEIDFCVEVVKQLKCIAVLCSYRFAPEHPYPDGYNDCAATLRWIRRQYPHSTIAVGGFSAGGTLALNVAYKLRNEIAAVVAFYPPMNFSAESDNDFAEKNPYTRNIFHQAYLRRHPNEAHLKNPCLSPSYATSDTLPPHVALLAAEKDPNVRDMIKFMSEMKDARPGSGAQEEPAYRAGHSAGKSFVGKVFKGVFHGWVIIQ